jgi:hypothetical protein
MNDDSTQRDEEQRAAPRNEDRRDAQVGMLPWLDDAVEELFRTAPARRSPVADRR